MITVKEQIEQDIERSIRDLFSDKDRFFRVDVDAVVAVILEVAVDPSVKITEANRFDCYYTCLGKSVAIVQGWKLNEVDGLTLPSETGESLRAYITRTYGQG